jgi:vacuolar iron transporter family protein
MIHSAGVFNIHSMSESEDISFMVASHIKSEKHKSNRLSDIILGGQDGLVNVLGVLLGVAAASQDTRIVLAGGLAATFAESISMAAVAYTSTVADRDFYYSEMDREKREIRNSPRWEKEELREIFRQKGFEGTLLEKIVDVITANEKTWLQSMMSEELKLSPVDRGAPLRSAWLVGVAALAGSLIPLSPFFFLPIRAGIYVSMVISAVTLFIVGAVKAKMTVGSWAKSGVQMAVIGTISALAGYVIGLLFQTSNV